MTLTDHPDLHEEEVSAFLLLVESHLAAPTDRRDFLWIADLGSARVTRPDNSAQDLSESALNALFGSGLIVPISRSSDMARFAIAPAGVRFYQDRSMSSVEPLGQVEDSMRRLVNSEDFQRRHPSAAASWTQAAQDLWAAESHRQISQIGHHLREALQMFADDILVESEAESTAEVSKTVVRLAAALDRKKPTMGPSTVAAITKLIDWWKAISDRVQAVEHAHQNVDIRWRDARRVVFLTLVIMHELDEEFRL